MILIQFVRDISFHEKIIIMENGCRTVDVTPITNFDCLRMDLDRTGRLKFIHDFILMETSLTYSLQWIILLIQP